MPKYPDLHLSPVDANVPRNRLGRWFVLISYIALVVLLMQAIGCLLSFKLFGVLWLGSIVGLAGAGVILAFTLNRFLISVEQVSAFITTDLLYVLLSKGKSASPKSAADDNTRQVNLAKTYPVYLPGLHPAFPWEDRDRENNISLKEVSGDVKGIVQVVDGEITFAGSYRYRPDFTRLIPFLGGVATSAEELSDLVKAYVVEDLSEKTIEQALKYLEKLNDDLMLHFGTGESQDTTQPADKVVAFERRFGLSVGDVTIATLLPAEDIRKTRGALDEAAIITQGAYKLLGYSSVEEGQAAKAAKSFTQEDFDKARDRFMAASGNLEGMDIKRFEVDVRGIDPEAVKALPAAVAAVSGVANKRQAPSRKRSKK